jgi:molybdopterin converting factor small subunit
MSAPTVKAVVGISFQAFVVKSEGVVYWLGIPVVDVKITFVGLIQRLVGHREEAVQVPEETTLGGLLRMLTDRYGRELEERLLEHGDLAAHATILINGRNAIPLGALQARLSDGSESQVEIVVLGPPLMGG